jgi:DNA helicase-2/ATP-dependent DNA helicase PcrA
LGGQNEMPPTAADALADKAAGKAGDDIELVAPAGVDESTADAEGIPAEEEELLARVLRSLKGRVIPLASERQRYDADLVAMRDEIGEARLEDVAALVAQMERLQGVSLRRVEAQGVMVDPSQPYFAHLRLREGGRERDVCIGRSTYVDSSQKVSIVDWRHAPVSQLYYRYPEGSDYEEEIGDRDVEGEILVRRTVTITGGELIRIAAPQGVFAKVKSSVDPAGRWQRTDVVDVNLAGGEGTATRPKRGVLGDAGLTRAQRLDRHLPEIAALIDPRQFELISKPDSGVVVIQGGAGSGKTTIGLHRMAYLAFKAPNRFATTHMLVVTYGSALAAYISEVLPALGVKGVRVATFQSWAQSELARVIPWLKVRIDDDSPPGVSRVKSHPAVLRELETRARRLKGKKGARIVVDLWAELLTDLPRLIDLCCSGPDLPLARADVIEAHRLIKEGVAAVTDREPTEKKPKAPRGKSGKRPHGSDEAANQFNPLTARVGERAVDAAATAGRDQIDEIDYEGDETMRGETGIDGLLTAGDVPVLDLGDVAILLRAYQLVRGSREGISHLFVDEAQDLSPVELAVLIGETRGKPKEKSITLAGDTSQRLFLDNGFRDWRTVLHELALDHVAVEPLRIAYRSTREILQLARFAMGPLADRDPPLARRSGAPVEAHVLPGAGAAVAFLAEVLRPLFAREPRATVAVLARHAEQADRYYDGLARAEIPSLRRVRVQDFSFRPGVEVTEIRQVKGLEFDYVILVDANAATFGTDDESRHLFHIAATRAAHQLWLIVTAAPSPLFPPALLAESRS